VDDRIAGPAEFPPDRHPNKKIKADSQRSFLQTFRMLVLIYAFIRFFFVMKGDPVSG
jgi:hypothetical protein